MPFRLINQIATAADREVAKHLNQHKQPPADPTPISTYRAQLQKVQSTLNGQRQKLISTYRQIETLEAELTQARAQGQSDHIADLEIRLARTRASRDQTYAQQVKLAALASESQSQLVDRAGTAAAFETLERVPLVLLPVRLETRYFAADADHYELRVRIYPDEIHIDNHQPLLSAAEAEMGQQYWEARLADGEESESAIALWSYLCQQVGEDRAFQVVSQLNPDGLGRRGDNTTDSQTQPPPLPDAMLAPESWAETPKARALPDRWAIVGYRDDKRLLLHWTRPIPTDLPVSPDFTAPVADDDIVEPDDGIRWMTDFETAESVGMAARIRVDKSIARVMDRLLVFGIDASQTPAESTFELNQLLQAHTHTGLNLVPPGSPTNNTRQGKTEYRQRSVSHRESHQQLLDSDIPSPEASYGARLAAALGLNKGLFRFLKHRSLDSEGPIHAMYRALWPVSWGDFLKYQIDIPVPGKAEDFVENHYRRYVRPRGILPTLRVEAQPYGILPIVSLQRWRSQNPSLLLFENRLVNGLRSLLKLWLVEPERIPRLFGNEEAPHVYADPQRSLIRILSMAPTTQISSGKFFEYATADYAAQARSRMQQWWPAVLNTLTRFPMDLSAAVGGIKLDNRKTGLRERRFSMDNPLVTPQANKTQPLEENYIAALAAHPPISQVRNHQLPGAQARSLLYVMLRNAFLEVEISRDHNYANFFNSLNILKDLSVETLESLTTDVIDGASHRLDAWISSIANRRLAEVREKQTEIHIGGYGWVEGLEPPGEAPQVGAPVLEDPDSAGYLHMPSLAQAKTAAILYGANQAQAEQTNRSSLYAINLSSEKVRRGKWLLDGLNQGQPLGALLGYWLERRLIERGLARLIAPMRDLAPLSVGDIPTQTLTNTHVMDGLQIYRLWKAGILRQRLRQDYNRQLTQVLTELDFSQDALSDLLLAEGVHQATSGNPVRAAAAFDAMADGSSRVDALDVTATPVTSQQLEHRVIVMLPETVPTAWPGDEQRIRAIAEPRLNAWAAALLGNPGDIHFTATFSGPEQTVEVQQYTLADFDLCPLDVVYLSGSQSVTPPLVELLRLFLQLSYRAETGETVGAETVTLQLRPDNGYSLEDALAIAQNLMRVISTSRPLQPVDLTTALVATGPSVDPDQSVELTARAQATQASVTQIQDNLTQDATQPQHWWQAALLVGAVDPALADGISSMTTTLSQRQGAAAEQIEPTAQIQALLGKEFRAIALFTPSNPGELNTNFANQLSLLEGDTPRPKRWLQDYARVRPSIEALDLTLTLGDLFTAPTTLQVAQLPYQAGQVWVGDRRPEQALPQLSLVAHTPFNLSAQAPLSGLVIDAWTESLPQDKTVTGLAFHYDEPKAQAPQAILIAVPPDMNRDWQFEDLESALLETFDLLKLRAVSLAPRNLGNYLPAITTLGDQRPDV
ncbi:MAG: hypothetical protein AAFX95_02670 [Cyanobacteria bacterium J06639_16]